MNTRISNVNNYHIKNSLDAIAEIHKVLDDDQNGAVDSLESEDVRTFITLCTCIVHFLCDFFYF